ncbi:hypothetical protein [Lentilactobacillus sp. SPB1-3]|uniref:Uncharacterized protein n=1 Tax=Lentilactobacillus terminaliae TaxID=3003483 RepID=A0ACD5DCI4_9LACO|nr:hypothetical protein [Lentilactobacillus sp. SPB1-3]MCZ0978109.1 hypothetical protein [Lentilactobacillus sp. SPB1-3]
MRHNFQANRFMAITGIETLLLGVYLMYVSNVFANHRYPHMHHNQPAIILQHAQDPYLAIILVIIGTYAILVAMYDMQQKFAKRIALTSMLSIWSAYLAAFIYRDLLMGSPISLDSLLIACIVVRIFLELWIGMQT